MTRVPKEGASQIKAAGSRGALPQLSSEALRGDDSRARVRWDVTPPPGVFMN